MLPLLLIMFTARSCVSGQNIGISICFSNAQCPQNSQCGQNLVCQPSGPVQPMQPQPQPQQPQPQPQQPRVCGQGIYLGSGQAGAACGVGGQCDGRSTCNQNVCQCQCPPGQIVIFNECRPVPPVPTPPAVVQPGIMQPGIMQPGIGQPAPIAPCGQRAWVGSGQAGAECGANMQCAGGSTCNPTVCQCQCPRGQIVIFNECRPVPPVPTGSVVGPVVGPQPVFPTQPVVAPPQPVNPCGPGTGTMGNLCGPSIGGCQGASACNVNINICICMG